MREEIHVMGYYDGDWGVGQWLAMSAMMLLFWGTLIGLAVYAISAFRSGGQRADAGKASAADPAAVLAERFARGEIDENDFLRRRELLQSTAARP